MNNELLAILEYIEQERGISKEQLVDAVEKAILSASRKSIHPASDLEVKIDRSTGEIKAWAKLEIVEKDPNNDQILAEKVKERISDAKVGDIIRWEVTPKNFGRIAAQTAKQAILQHLRKAEKAIVKEEFQDKVGEIVNGTVRRFEAGSIIIDLQKAEGIISPKDKVAGEQYMPGDRINALLVKVDTSGAGPSLILSRSSANFVKKLFEREVTEIHDGVVEIVAIAREAGNRTKIAVRSNDQRVDPVGACVGMRGMRVKNITNELGGERVDIIRFENEIRAYAANALHPAKALSIEMDEAKKSLVFKVNPENSRLAFGKKAQNVRLSSKLLGWSINIVVEEPVKEESFEEKKTRMTEQLSAALGVSGAVAEILVNNGFLSIDGLKAVEPSDLSAIEGLQETDVKTILEALANAGGSEAEVEPPPAAEPTAGGDQPAIQNQPAEKNPEV